jgi:hypothetical protein
VLNLKPILSAVLTLAIASVLTTARAQEVFIPDPGLNTAIRDALAKPTGPLTEADLLSLTFLSAGGRSITNVAGLEAARNLGILDLDNNSITNFPIADALTNLTILDLFGNRLTSFSLTPASSKLTILDLAFNSLTDCSLPAGLTNLDTLFLEGNALTNFNLPAGLTELTQLDLSANEITSLTLPPDMAKLNSLVLDSFFAPSELRTLVLSEPLAATNLAETVASLRNQGVSVSTYPLTPELIAPRRTDVGSFTYALSAPPGVYTIFSSTDLVVWSEVGVSTNQIGTVRFEDVPPLAPQKFFRARFDR